MTDRNKPNHLSAVPESAQQGASEAHVPTGADPGPGPAARGDSIGAQLRAARAARGLTVFDCARQLHLPAAVLQRLEADNFGSPEDFVFVRGALTGYARFLALPPGSCDAALRNLAPPTPPRLVSVAHTSHARWLLQRYGTAATYIVLTATIAVPLVWLGLRGGLQRPVARIVALDQPAVSAPLHKAAVTAATPSGSGAAAADQAPFRAAMTPFAEMGFSDPGPASAVSMGNVASLPTLSIRAAPAPSDQHALTLDATADCWFEITNADGDKIASGMLHAGDSRTWHSTGLLRVTLGNAAGVSVTRDGQPLPLDASAKNNVARFDVFGPTGASENH